MVLLGGRASAALPSPHLHPRQKGKRRRKRPCRDRWNAPAFSGPSAQSTDSCDKPAAVCPVEIAPIDSNDSLYGGDSKFLAENNKLCETVMAQILEHLKALAKDEALKRQSSLGLSFFNSILAHGDLRNNRLNQLSVHLWHLAQRHGSADTRTMVKTLEYIKKRSKQPDMAHLTELALRLPLQTRT
uniref:VPS35 endosomal protein-sorting factor-like n=1 Tax=Molossus molossus TaxID=27622 RepID=A0A7J8J470_MOLMO|nr:VPS35 endosomal protein sorting factor like [Molossus molossus]